MPTPTTEKLTAALEALKALDITPTDLFAWTLVLDAQEQSSLIAADEEDEMLSPLGCLESEWEGVDDDSAEFVSDLYRRAIELAQANDIK